MAALPDARPDTGTTHVNLSQDKSVIHRDRSERQLPFARLFFTDPEHKRQAVGGNLIQVHRGTWLNTYVRGLAITEQVRCIS
jgi:hypothetical protein